MRAHSQRRLIWFLNVVLGAAIVALVAWIFLDVRKAVADGDFLRPKWATKAVEDFDAQPKINRSALAPPVTLEELEEIDRREFQTPSKRRFHWIYSGPMPPPPPPEEAAPEVKAPVEDDLSKLGRPLFLLYIGPRGDQEVAEESVLYWEFSPELKKAFSPGEFIHGGKGPKPPRGGIKLHDVKRVPGVERTFHLLYGVYDDPDGEPLKTGVYTYEAKYDVPQDVADRVRGGTTRPAASAAAPAAGPGAPAGPTEGSVSVVGEEPVAPEPYVAPDDAEEMVKWESPTKANVEVDQPTWDWLRKSDPDTVAGSVKTQVARDEQGRVIGLQITGLSADTPADRFDVKPGDILVSINDQPVKSRSDAMNIVQGLDPNTRLVKVVVDRRGRLVTFNIDPRDPKTRRAARALDNR